MKRKRQEETRTWCNVCKLWIDDNRLQRDQHESGTRHKTAYAKLVKDIAKKNETKRAEEKAKAQSVIEEPSRPRATSAHELLERAVASASGELPQPQTTSLEKLPASSDAQQTEIGNDEQLSDAVQVEASVSDDAKEEGPFAEVTAVETAAAVPASAEVVQTGREQLDENGYPLPVDATLGAWAAVEDANEDVILDGDRETISDNHTAKDNELTNNVITTDETTMTVAGTAGNTEPAAEVVFKKRVLASSKRRRRKRV